MKLSKIFLFAIFLVFLANYFWAQSCFEGERRCNPNDPYQVQMCQNGVWTSLLSCNPDTTICQDGDCVQKQSSPPDICLNEGERRCNPNNPYEVQICQNGVWTSLLSCNPDTMICQDGDCVVQQSPAECNDNQIRCDPNDPTLTKRQVCLGGKWIEAQPSCDGEISVCSSGICVDSRCNESVIMCSSKFSNAYLICENGTWSRKFCPSGMICRNGSCVNNTNNTNINNTLPVLCPPEMEGAKRCNPNDPYQVQMCQNGVWTSLLSCNPDTTICQNGECVPKQSSPPQQPPSSQPTSSSGGGGGTGGGSVSAKPCSKWSDWFVNSSIEIVDPATPSISCLNITYMRWCVRADGSLDNSRFEKKTEINCGQKSSVNTEEVCNYQLVLKQDYLDYSDGKCRTCANETYVYTCYPSNKKDFSKQRNSISCGPARECTPEELNKVGKVALNPPSSDNYSLFGSLVWFVNQVGPAVLLLIGLLVLGVAGFLFWKFYSSAKKEQSEE